MTMLQAKSVPDVEDMDTEPAPSLSLKRHHQPKTVSASSSDTDFLTSFSSGCQGLLTQCVNYSKEWRSKSLDINLIKLSKLSAQLHAAFQGFLCSYAQYSTMHSKAQNDNISQIVHSMKFPAVFQKLTELFFAVVYDGKAKVRSSKLFVEVYEVLIDLALLFLCWMTCPVSTKDMQSIPEYCLCIFSVLWAEDHDLLDLKLPTGLTRSSTISLCQVLRDNGLSLNSPNNSHGTVFKCLRGICMFNSSLSFSWRCFILMKWGLNNTDVSVCSESLSNLSYFCTGLSTHYPVVNNLGTFIKALNVMSCNTQIIVALSKLIAPLATVLHGGYCVQVSNERIRPKQNTVAELQCGEFLCLHITSESHSVNGLNTQSMKLFGCIEKFINSFINKHGTQLDEIDLINKNLISNLPVLLNKREKQQNNAVTLSLLKRWFLCVENAADVDPDLLLLFLDPDDCEWTEKIAEHLKSFFGSAMSEKCVKMQCNMARLCGCVVAKYANSSSQPIFLSSLLHLCQLSCNNSAKASSTAHVEIERLAKMETNVLFMHRKFICQQIIETMVYSRIKSRSTFDILEDFAQLFDMRLKNFVDNNLSFLLSPVIITSCNVDPEAKEEILTVLAQSTEMPKADMIMQNFKSVFCHGVMKKADLDKLFSFLEKETRIKKDSMILLNYGSLVQHLVAHVSTNVDQVCAALHMIHQIKSPSDQKTSTSELLKPHLLSVLTFFNGQLRLSSLSLNEKQQICESIVCLLKLMDKNDVVSVCGKIVNTLCLAQHSLIDSDGASVCCRAWDTLVRCVEPANLGGILSQVVAMVLPFLDSHPEKVAATIKYLVIEKSSSTKNHFEELHFLPDHEALTKIRKFIDETVKKLFPQHSFIANLKQALKQVSHENNAVRVFALQRIRLVLQENQIAVQRHHLVGSGPSDLVRHLVSTLLSCCRDSNAQVRLLALKNLGEIGAVAPDRLSLTTESKGQSSSCNHFLFDDQDFAYDLLTSVVQAFLAAKPKHQDISAFAVQELLKVYDCHDGSKDSKGRQLWRRFPETVQAVLEPHLSSRYMLKLSEINLSSLKKPILHRKQNMGFQEWIGTMCAVLMQMATTGPEDSSKVGRVAQACAAVVRNDINVALFLLPHLVMEVLRKNCDHTNFIIEEVMAVLDSTEQMKDTRESTSTASTPSMQGNSSNKLPALRGSPLSQLSAQSVFTVLDHVTQWQRQPAPTSGGSLAKTCHAREQEIAKNFLARVPQKSLALASLRCRAHSRALLHFETYLRQSCDGKCDSEAASFLQRMFVEMDETDGVAGLVAVRGVEPTPETQLKLLQSTGALQDAVACYERIISSKPDDLTHHKGFVKCLIDLGQSTTALSVIVGMLNAHQDWEAELKPLHIEACWRLGQWDLLEEKTEAVTMTTHTDWSVAVGRTLLAIKSKQWGNCQQLLDNLYLSQTEALSAASMESCSYQRGYDSILRLHILSDLERAVSHQSQNDTNTIDDVMSLWQLRLRMVQPSFRAREPMLSLQRVLLPLLTEDISDEQTDAKRHLGKLWLQSAKLSRKSGHLQTAYSALLSAQQFALPQYCIEHAKWLWQKGESHQALLSLQRGVSEHFASATSSDEERTTRAKAMLLVAKLMEESSSFDSNTVLKQYKEVVSFMGDWEDSHFYCAKYYDKLMTALLGENRASGKAHHLYYIMYHYGRSLCYGTSHIYESLTKLLTVWFDYGANAAKMEKAGKPQSHEDVQRLVDVIADLRKRLPAYIFLVAFSQLTSRICHQHEPTYRELKEILVKVIQAFPQRSLWSMLAISKSTFKQRAARCQEIFQRVSYKSTDLSKLISDSLRLTNQLLELCNKPVTSVQPLSINTHFKSLKRTVENDSFSKIMLPLQQFMTVALPQTKEKLNEGSQTVHDPFPDPTIHIVGFNDVVEILPSLQRPKKITIRASDGSSRIFLCKPKDDLRKDARLTEFAAIVNKCLKRDPESGRRQLRIRTYAVIPLNEECGLIEWVNGVLPLRSILLQLYRQRRTLVSNRELFGWVQPKHASLQKKLDVYRNKLLPRHPPVFHEWFLSTFPDPSAWYNSKLAYARSVAVMSMVGYILGLGDRHGENILFDSNSGEAMHVDFNCLFNKGMTLEVPEIVPFRLTHNMVDAMGPTKYEGFFRRACEVTMNVLREQREPLMSVLKTFIHDPLVEWSKKGRGGASSFDENSGEVVNEKALSHMNDIDKRLRGIVAKSKGLPLSIEGHVHYLIQEATDEEKLCQMYIGWAPFM
uniref:Serine/threonine-protein kinase ATR n=1 Tax=Phallusia mammillata TaxID=59560 RepID=A0A6F9D7T6_9ASCI|nr:serine/threonine-protein kinase atr [Phallusia mammillata]